jgi:tight adherence protein C
MTPSPAVLVAVAALVCGVLGLAQRRRRQPTSATSTPGIPGVVRGLAALPVPRVIREGLGGSADPTRLVAAGLAPGIAGPMVCRARAGGAVAGLLVGGTLGLLALPLLALAPLAAWIGRMSPDRAVLRQARARRTAIVNALPDLLDLMVICVEAGMALDPALALAADRLGGPLGHEVRATLADQSLGTPRRLAYRALADRTGAEDVGRLVASLLQAEELGTPLATALAGQADALRAARRQRARDSAARAAPRIQLVVALVMVPGAMLLIIGVMLIELVAQVGVVMGS